jgi:hypothetical protein
MFQSNNLSEALLRLPSLMFISIGLLDELEQLLNKGAVMMKHEKLTLRRRDYLV